MCSGWRVSKIPTQIALDELLGRGVFSEKNSRRAARKIPFHVFLEREGVTTLSVDRLDVAPADVAVAIADRVGTRRGASFFGWAVVRARQAGMNGRRVEATPLRGVNPYHADIVLPQAAADDREEQKRHTQELADAARWRDRDKHRSRKPTVL